MVSYLVTFRALREVFFLFLNCGKCINRVNYYNMCIPSLNSVLQFLNMTSDFSFN